MYPHAKHSTKHTARLPAEWTLKPLMPKGDARGHCRATPVPLGPLSIVFRLTQTDGRRTVGTYCTRTYNTVLLQLNMCFVFWIAQFMCHVFQERNIHRSDIVYKWKQSKIDMDYLSVEFDLRRQQSWMMDLFLKNMQVFTSQDDGLDYCDVFNQLFGLSFWRHPFTEENGSLGAVRMREWATDEMLHFSKSVCWRNKLIYEWPEGQ